MKTIKDIEYHDWFKLSDEEMLDLTINTMFIAGKINQEEKLSLGEYGGEGTIELCCVEDDDKLALTKGWIKIIDKPVIKINLWRGNGMPYLMSERVWDSIHEYLESLL